MLYNIWIFVYDVSRIFKHSRKQNTASCIHTPDANTLHANHKHAILAGVSGLTLNQNTNLLV